MTIHQRFNLSVVVKDYRSLTRLAAGEVFGKGLSLSS